MVNRSTGKKCLCRIAFIFSIGMCPTVIGYVHVLGVRAIAVIALRVAHTL
jgi:hypothetical protein